MECTVVGQSGIVLNGILLLLLGNKSLLCMCHMFCFCKLHIVKADKQVNKISLKCSDLNIKMYAVLLKISYNKQFSLVKLIKSVMIYMCIPFSDFKVMLQCFYFIV